MTAIARRSAARWDSRVCGNPQCLHVDWLHAARHRGACRQDACRCEGFVKLSKGNKHHAQAQPGGFGSKAERGQYNDLYLLARAKVITHLEHHKILDVTPPARKTYRCDRICWCPDFQYDDADGVHVVHEFKSPVTTGQAFEQQLKLARARYPQWRFRVSMKHHGRNEIVREYPPTEVS